MTDYPAKSEIPKHDRSKAPSRAQEDLEFRTSISRVEAGYLSVRGYSGSDMIANASGSEAAFLVIHGRRPSRAELRVFDAILSSCADHGLVNTGSVSARYVMSGSASLPAAIAAGVLAFGQHTGTANLTAELLLEISDGAPDRVGDDAIENALRTLRDRKEAIPGLGHPIHREIDPRMVAVREVAVAEGMAGPYVDLLDRVQQIGSAIVSRDLVVNVDGLMGALFLEMGFAPAEMLAVNILGAIPGIAAHAIEEAIGGKHLRFPRDHEAAYELPHQTREWKNPGEMQEDANPDASTN